MTDYAAGKGAATTYHTRYGQEAVLLRAIELRRNHPTHPYALGFWQRAFEFAGFTFEETADDRPA